MRELCQKAFTKFLQLELCEPYEVINARTYYDKYASEEEKRAFEKAFEKYRKKFTSKFEDRAREAFHIYLRYGLDNERFMELAKKFDVALPVVISYPEKYAQRYASAEEKEVYKLSAQKQALALAEEEKAKQKYIWEYCDNVDWHRQKVNELAEKLKISVKILKNQAFIHAKKELKMTDQEIKKRVSQKADLTKKTIPQEKKYEIIFTKLLVLENEQEIIDFLYNSKASVHYLRKQLAYYLQQLKPNISDLERQALTESLLVKINYFAQKLAHNLKTIIRDKKDEENKPLIPEAIKAVEQFLLSNAPTKEQFCWDNNINIDLFEKYLTIIEQYDTDLYKVYSAKIKNQNIKNQAIVIGKLNRIIDGLNNGIKVNEDQVRPFDLIDYYLITNLSLEKFYGICAEQLNEANLKLVNRFFRKYRDDSYLTPIEIQKIMTDRDEVTTTKDENGFPIAGTGRIISEDEKQAVIDFLKRNNIVVTTCTYNIAFRRYILGTLDIYEADKSDENIKQR